MALEEMLTLPLKMASETLAQELQPKADPQAFARQVDQNNFAEKAPDFFRQAAAAIAAQAAQSAAVSAGGGGGGGGMTEADPEDYDHSAEAYALQDFQKQQREAAAVNVPAPNAAGVPYYLQRPEEAAAPTGGGRGWLNTIGSVIGDTLDAPGEFARSVGTGLANVGDVVGDTGLPGSDVARRILHVPDAAETGFLEGWKKQHGSDFSAFDAIKQTNRNLTTGQEWLNERMDYLTGHTLDPIINNTIGQFSPGTARWMTAAVDRLGEMVPFVLLMWASGGTAAASAAPSLIGKITAFSRTPVGMSFLAQGAAQLAEDTQLYSEGKITGGQYLAAAGINIGANLGPDVAEGLFSQVLHNIKAPGVRNQLMKDIAEASGKAEGLDQQARGIRSAEHLAESMPSTEEVAAQKFGADANLTRQERMDRAAAQLGPEAPPLGIGIPAKGTGQEAAPLPEYSVRQPEAGVTVKETKAATKTITETVQTPTDRMSDRHTLTTEGGDRLDYRGTHINDVTVVREGKGTGTALLNHAVEAIRERNPEAVITADLNSPSGAALFAKQPGAEFFDRTGTPITAEDALKLAGEQKGSTVAIHPAATAEQVPPTPIRAEETLADVHAMRAKARTSNPEELQRLARNEGLTRTHEELAADRGEVGAAPKPVREERTPTPMKREPRVAAGEAGALRAKGKGSSLSEPVDTKEYAALREKNAAGATLTEDAPTHLYKIKDKDWYYGVNETADHWKTGKPEKELVAVMNNGTERGALDTVMAEAKEKGVTLLDAWAVKNEKGEFLPRLYAKYGWKEVDRMPFDPSYYPDKGVLDTIKAGWKDQGWKEGDPYPDVVYMRPEADLKAGREIEKADRAVTVSNNKQLDEYAKFRSETGRPIQWASNDISKEHPALRAAYEDATNISESRATKALDRLDDFLRGGEDGMIRVSVYGDTIRKWFSGMGPVVERIMKAVVRIGRTFHDNELGALMRKGSLPKFGDLKVEDVLDFGAARRWLHPEESHGQWARHMVERIGGTEDFWHNHFNEVTAHVEEKYGLLGKGKVGILANSGKEFGPEAGPRAYGELKDIFDRGRKLKGANGETIDMSKWYDNFWKTMVKHFGDDAEVVTKLAAATQMNASPAAGIPQIIRGYLQWKMGEPIGGMTNANIRKQMESILMGIDPKGTKIEPFYGALRYSNRVGKNSVAVDRWVIGAMGAKAESSGMLVSKLQGNPKFIRFSQSLIKMAADEAGVDPRAFQAGIWGGFRDNWDEMLKAAGGRPQSGDNNFFENILLNTMKKYDMRSPEGFVLNSLKSIEAQLTDQNTALAEVEYWQRTLKIKDGNEKMLAVDYNQKIAAANFLDTGKMPEHIRMGETKDEIARVAQQYKTAFETRVGMASDDTLRELKTVPKWQKEIVDATLEQRARSNEQVSLAWKALPKEEVQRLNTLGWMRIPEKPAAQEGVVRALKQLEDIQTKEQFLAWAKRKGNREIVGDPMAFVGENIPTGHTYGTGKRVYKQMASSDYYQSQPFYENREQLNIEGIKNAIRDRFRNPPEYARNLADTLGLHDGKVGEEASILGQCGASAAESVF